jgi:YHS domain-containing protein
MKVHQPISKLCIASIVLAIAALTIGCGKTSEKENSPQAPSSPASAQATEKTTDAKGLAELSPEDRALAAKQKVCPVSGEMLGAMDKPVKVTIKGQTVFLCCPACESAIKKDPDKYLAKLKAAQEK